MMTPSALSIIASQGKRQAQYVQFMTRANALVNIAALHRLQLCIEKKTAFRFFRAESKIRSAVTPNIRFAIRNPAFYSVISA